MEISDLDIIQISMECVGGFICAMLGVILIINRHDSRSMKLLRKLFFYTSLLFFADALAYLYKGSTQPFGLFMTRFSNLSVFFLNYLLAYLSTLYIYSLLQEKLARPSKIYLNIILSMFAAAVLILVVNLFTDWMYYFDEANLYHRNWGWYLYTGLSLVCLITSCVLILRHRKFLDRFTLFSLMCFELFPIVAVVFQSIFYGITITNIGIGASVILILIAYLVNWNRADSENQFLPAQLRRSYGTSVLFLIMVVSNTITMVSCIISIRQISSEISLRSSQVIANIVNDHLENLFLRPITVTETMSKDYNLLNNIRSSENGDEEAAEQVSAYLDSIRSGFGYQMVYLVCEQSKAYYTYNGFVKTVDPESDSADFWYRDFVAAGQKYALQVDTDEANNWDLSVFINNAVLDENGQLLGVCGVGLKMTELLGQLRAFEEKYDIHISLLDQSGKILIDTNSALVGSSRFSPEHLESVSADAFSWEETDGSPQLVKRMADFRWYLVVDDLAPERVHLSPIIVPNVFIFLASMFMLAVTFSVITIRERKISVELMEKRRTSLIDELTGLKNRRALDEDCKQIQQAGNLQQLTVILMDLNGLKTVNDNLGHQAGDELLIGTAQCLTQAMQDYGQMYRTGGDEFLILLNCTSQELSSILSKFDQLTSSWRGSLVSSISTARGVARYEDYPTLSFTELVDIADQKMYEDKQLYYSKTGNDRRK